jgi:hypothetical protein
MDDSKLNTLSQYLSMGWALVPLHHVMGATCSCRAAGACKSAGKHPRLSAWQREANLVRTVERLSSWPTETNWGLATGRASGVWALDVDPKNGGREALQVIMDAGLLAPTRAHGTGGNGRHFLYRMPGDFVPTNRTGALPPGIDVRGDGGQIVLPPSVSGVGAYELDGTMPLDVSDAFPGLLDLIRPPAPVPRPPRELVARADPGGRWESYARAAVDGELRSLAETHSSRNSRAWAAACRVIELCNAPWAGLDADDEYDRWREAGHAHPGGIDVPPTELDAVWRSALRHVAGRPAEAPADKPWPPRGDVDTLDFQPGPGSTTAEPGPAQPLTPFAPIANGVSAGSAGSPPPTGPTVAEDPFTLEVARQKLRMAAADEARRQLAAERAGRSSGVAAMLAECVDGAGLDDIPEPQAVVDGYLFRDTLARINGRPGQGKSFVAIDLAAAVGAGLSWHGRAVQQGKVLYVVAEGMSGIRRRVRAWEKRHDRELENVAFLGRAIQTMGEEWQTLIEMIEASRPSLVIVDTQARSTVGADENSATDMGQVVHALDELRARSGACVLLIHHKGHKGEHGRGSNAVEGALHSEFDVSKSGANVMLTTTKQKDCEPAPTLIMTLNSVGDSAVLVSSLDGDPADPFAPMATSSVDVGRARVLALIGTMLDHYSEGFGGSPAEIKAVWLTHPLIRSLSADAKKKAWARAWARLEESGRLVMHPQLVGTKRFRFVEMPDLDLYADNESNSITVREGPLKDWLIFRSSDGKRDANLGV